jgi:hypothetical protein
LLLASAAALAQTPPPDQTAPPPPPEVQPVPPAPPPEAPKPVVTYPTMGKAHELMVSENTWFRFGVQIQAWARYMQSPTKTATGDEGGYSLDLYLRRSRFFVVAQLLKGVSALVLFDQPNLGSATLAAAATETTAAVISKNFQPAIVQDAFGEVKFYGDAFMLEAGLMVVPFSHNGLQSTSSYIPLDVANTAAVLLGTATSVLRDTGFQLKGYELDDKLEWRLFVGSGLRQPAHDTAPIAHNAPRITAHVQYQFMDPDYKGYVYSGMTYGKKKLLGISAGFDFQKGDDIGSTTTNPYYAISAGVFGAWPLGGDANPKGGDELAFEAEYYRYDGGVPFPADATKLPTFLAGLTCTAGLSCAAIPKQNDFNVELGYYNKDSSFGVFGKFEMAKLDEADQSKALGVAGSKLWFGGGLKYFILENVCNFTLFYQRTQFPDADDTKINGINTFVFQTQLYYY